MNAITMSPSAAGPAGATSGPAGGMTAATKAARPRRLRRALTGFAAAALTLVAAAVAGAAYEGIAAVGDAQAYPRDGQMVDIGGYALHLSCRGQGSPTVVLDAGLGGSMLDWFLVQPELAATTRVCVYDRAGMGWSDASPLPRTPSHIAAELHALLEQAGVPAPYVLVGHSLAGKNVRLFAAAHPDEVAGMVLVDARSERIDIEASPAEAAGLDAAFEAQATMQSVARRLGLARLWGGAIFSQPLVPPATATELVLLQTQPAAIEETRQEALARVADDATLAGATLGAMPLIVIAASENMRGLAGWSEAQNALADLSTSGRLVVARSGHYVQLEDPRLVIDAVRDVVAEARNGR